MEIEEIIGEWECVIIQWKRRESEMRHRWEWVIDWLNECTNKFPWKVIDSMEFDVTCWKKREEKGKKTREKERWGKILTFPWEGYEWKGKRRGWTWVGGQGIWFPWNCLYWRMFDGIRLHMKVYGITWMNVLLPVKLSPWLRGKGDRVGHLPIKCFIPVFWAMNCLHGHKLSPCVRGKGDWVASLPTKRLIPVGGQNCLHGPELSPCLG